MRVALLLAPLLFAGCGGVVRTVHQASPAAPADEFGRVHPAAEVVEPVYAEPQRLVYLAALRTARAYFNGKTIRERAPEHLDLDDDEFWVGGNMRVAIDIVPLDEHHARVEMSAEGFGANTPIDPQSAANRRFRNYYERLDAEMRTIGELREMVGQTAATGSPAVATGTASPSGTSLP